MRRCRIQPSHRPIRIKLFTRSSNQASLPSPPQLHRTFSTNDALWPRSHAASEKASRNFVTQKFPACCLCAFSLSWLATLLGIGSMGSALRRNLRVLCTHRLDAFSLLGLADPRPSVVWPSARDLPYDTRR